MARLHKKKTVTPTEKTHKTKKSALTDKKQDVLFLIIITVLLIILLKPLVIDGLSPQGVDVVAGKGETHQITEFQKKTGERALWNPAIFGGMPLYFGHSPVTFSVDSFLNILGRFFGTVFPYYLFAAIGMYLLLRYLKMPPLIAFIGTIMFILIPHYKSLWLEGHFKKFRALMYLPWILASFIYFLDRRTILAAALFAIAFGAQIRTQHYQIVFYTAVMVFAVGVYPMLKDLLEKRVQTFLKSAGLLIVALILALMMAAQPLFLAKEYLPYSKRGKTTINLTNQGKDNPDSGSGVTMEYATEWSTHPTEMVTWLIPRFLGGMSNEVYTGKNVPELRNRAIPGYWGDMRFTQSYEYMGAITLFLALLGLIYYRKNKLVLSLGIFSVFLILLSFGRNFEIFYSLFYYGIPFFNKFRAPMMSVTVTFFIVAIFASYGLKYLYDQYSSEFNEEKFKKFLYLFGSFAGFGIIVFIAAQMLSYSKAGEPYTGQVLEMIKNVRKEWLINDVIRYLLLILLAGGVSVAYLRKKINFYGYALMIAALVLFDLISIQQRTSKDYVDADKLESRYFQKTSTDKFLLSDTTLYRVCPIGKLLNDNRWAYYHQTIGGYSPTKMYTIEELIENNLYSGWDPALPLNWNVLKILNVKYVIIPGAANTENLTLVHSDPDNQLYTYQFNGYMERGSFVGKYRVITDEYERLRTINSAEFDPARLAILEEEPDMAISVPDSSFSRLLEYTPNKVIYDVYTDKTSLFVISELFYPPGWKIVIDEQPVPKIYKTNHAVQSVIVPEGHHKIELIFEPESYYKNIKIASVSVSILYLVIAVSLFIEFRNKSQQNK